METVTDFILRGSKITADGDCSHEIKRLLLLGRKVMTNLESILKSRDITLPTKVHLVKRKKKENEVTQLYPTLCDPMDGSLPGSSVHGIFQARMLGCAAISFSRGSSQPQDRTLVSWQARGLSRVFSSTTVQKHQFFTAQLSLWSNSHIHT